MFENYIPNQSITKAEFTPSLQQEIIGGGLRLQANGGQTMSKAEFTPQVQMDLIGRSVNPQDYAQPQQQMQQQVQQQQMQQQQQQMQVQQTQTQQQNPLLDFLNEPQAQQQTQTQQTQQQQTQQQQTQTQQQQTQTQQTSNKSNDDWLDRLLMGEESNNQQQSTNESQQQQESNIQDDDGDSNSVITQIDTEFLQTAQGKGYSEQEAKWLREELSEINVNDLIEIAEQRVLRRRKLAEQQQMQQQPPKQYPQKPNAGVSIASMGGAKPQPQSYSVGHNLVGASNLPF